MRGQSFKHLLTAIGQRLPKKQLLRLNSVIRYLNIGHWMHEHGFCFQNRVSSREEVWSSVSARLRNQKVLYLEFGVAFGDSMRYWSRELKHPDSSLNGFDSFDGLPEHGAHWKKGQFDAGGQIPIIDDSRVHFFKGWFDQVLPTYSVPDHDVLVINLDADLYSSTIFVLRFLLPYITPGTYIYFDELNVYDHEARAFDEVIRESGFRFQPICADKTLTHAFFQRIA
jgi:hypothetical protein